MPDIALNLDLFTSNIIQIRLKTIQKMFMRHFLDIFEVLCQKMDQQLSGQGIYLRQVLFERPLT